MPDKEAPPKKQDDVEFVELGEEARPEEKKGLNKRMAVEDLDQLFVPSVPPRIVSKKFKVDPEKWKRTRRNGSLIFRTSYQRHTCKLDLRKMLHLKDDKDRRLKIAYIKNIFAKQTKNEFLKQSQVNRNMRKYVLSRNVYNACVNYERQLTLHQMRKLEDFDITVAKPIKNYTQFYPENLCESLKKGVCAWYKVVQFGLYNKYSDAMGYFRNEMCSLTEIHAEKYSDVDFKFFLGTLHVLLVASSLYQRIYDMEVLNNKYISNSREKFEIGTSISQMVGQINLVEKKHEPSAIDVESLLGEMERLYRWIQPPDEDFQNDYRINLMPDDKYLQQATEVYTSYLLCNYTDVENDAEKVIDKLKKILQQRKNEFGSSNHMDFYVFFQRAEMSAMMLIANGESRVDWDIKTLNVLTVLLECPQSKRHKRKRKPYDVNKNLVVDQGEKKMVEEVTERLKDLPTQAITERPEDTSTETKDLLDAKTSSEKDQVFKSEHEEGTKLYIEYLLRKNADESYTDVVKVTDELKQIYGASPRRHQMSFFDYFQLVQSSCFALIEDTEEWAVKNLKVLTALLNGPEQDTETGKMYNSKNGTQNTGIQLPIQRRDCIE